MRRILTACALLVGLTPHSALAQAGAPPPPAAAAQRTGDGTRQGVGFTAGLVSGLGFAYRRHFANTLGLQIGGSGWAGRDESFLSLGGEVMRTLSRSDRSRLYLVAGTSIWRNRGPDYDYSGCIPVVQGPSACVPVETQHTTGSLNVGAGIGLEFAGSHVGLSLEVPISVMLDLDESHRFERKGIYPIPGVSLIYYF
jgi:hypothetical protein